jgi:hypothetical protein
LIEVGVLERILSRLEESGDIEPTPNKPYAALAWMAVKSLDEVENPSRN